ncbi:DNA-dependent protein kinase catalytic subunit isoform 1 [Mucor ambiguus]|uniref:DNA-dependent protein kinase catalytic subunit isoform 1 n=1 Tax=Mucor ambiguus TaxID=91626 RepID=A0A0C9LWT0_9FUNG|nr:DNA-dependent protein kinase catalytic subunit isoform 1 [Mucor ambiguus]
MSRQLTTIEHLAQRLVELCNEPHLNEQTILQIIKDLETELLSNLAEKNVDIVCSILFKEKGPMYGFMVRCRHAKSGDLATAVAKALGIMSVFIEERQKQFQKYANIWMIIAKNVAITGGYANARAAAFDVMMALIKESNKYDTSDFDIADIYQKFEDEYTTSGKPATIKAKIVELLGSIGRYHPANVEIGNLERLKGWCFNNLLLQVSRTEKFEHQTSQGYLNCLNSLICRKDVEFVPKNSSESEKLFHIILKILQMSVTTRYIAPIAAMALFTRHTRLFSNLLLPNSEQLYICLSTWAGHHNSEVSKNGLLAFEQFIKELSTVLYYNIQGEQELQTFFTFMRRFNDILEQADSVDDMYKVSIAIRSVGYFAKILTKVKNTDVEALRKSLVKISEWLYSDTNAKKTEYIRHLPAFIKAYTAFAQTMDVIPENLLDTLGHMCKIFIERVPYATGYLRRSGCSNIYQLLLMLYKKGQGLGRSFTNLLFERALTFTATNIIMPNEDPGPVYKKLLYFWKVILDKTQYTTWGAITENYDGDDDNLYPDKEDKPTAHTKKELQNMLYDVFITNLIKMIQQLNLNVVVSKKRATTTPVSAEAQEDDDDTEDQANVIANLRPVNHKDFILFQNLVDFWSTIVKDISNTRLVHWVYIFGAALIELSVQHPMVSGLYRMLSEILVICEKEQLFAGCETYFSSAKQQQQQQQQQSAAAEEKPAEYVTYLVYREYLKEVWHRLQQFTDELLASSLCLILAYPTEFFDINELITPLEKALRLGITYHPLATVAMNSLDKLLDPNLNYHIGRHFLSHILPCINEYLLIGVVNFTEQETGTKKTFKVPTAAERRYRMVHTRATSDEIGVEKQEYADLPELQRRMMQFLGRLGGKNKQLLAQGKDAIEDSGMLAWDPVKKIKLRVPFLTVKVDIYLDEFLPRICELAESSPDRQVKIAACELLHGLVIYMIGSSAFAAKTTKNSTESLYHTYYERVFPVMLKLAIDADPIARDMYRLFYNQIIHWLTNNAHADNPETLALLQSLLDASCDTDAGLREYGAECIREFVAWSIKQTSRSTDGAQNIKSLLKRLYNLMASSSASKRFGASLVFNRIYRQFREEHTLVDEYTIEILGQLFLSLKMTEADHPSIGTRDQITEAITHITKIINKKVDVFLKEDPASRRPFIGANDVIALPQLVRWAFTEGGSLQRNYAKLCISFFSKFVVLLPGVKTSKQWVSHELRANSDFLVNIFETDHLKPPSMLSEEEEIHIVSIYLSWIKRLNSTLDAYVWLIERDIANPSDILETHSSHLMLAIAFFIRNSPEDYLEDMLNVHLAEKSKIKSIYTYISVRLIYFFDLVFGPKGGDDCFRYVERIFSDTLYHKNFMDMIARALLLPKDTSEIIQSHQDNVITQSGMKRMFEISQRYISTMIAKRSADLFIEKLASSISSALITNKVDLAMDAARPMERSALIEMSQTVDAIKYLQSIRVLDKVCQRAAAFDAQYPSSAFAYCETLLKNFLGSCKSAQEPLRIQLLGNMTTICFAQPGFAESYCQEFLAFSVPAKRFAHKEKLEIFQKFDKYVAECITTHLDAFSSLFKKYLNLASDSEEDTYKTIHGYIMALFEYLEINRLSERKLVWSMTDYLIQDESLLQTIITRWSKEDQQALDVISLLKRLFGADPTFMSRSRGKPVFGLIWGVFIRFLKYKSFGVRLAALDLLPVFICLNEEDVKNITHELALNSIDQLPRVQGKNYIRQGTSEYNMIISTLDKLLVPMVTFKSVALFNLLMVTFVKEADHIHKDVIESSIESFSNGLGLTSFLDITKVLMDYFKDPQYSITHKQNITKVVLVLLRGANEGHVIAFFKQHLGYILGVASQPVDKEMASLDDLHMKANCLYFMQAYFNLISKEVVGKGKEMDILWANCKENHGHTTVNKEMLKLIKFLYEGLNQDVTRLTAERREAIFTLHREALNTFGTWVMRVNNKSKAYDAVFYLGDEQFIWDILVDPELPIHLDTQFSQPLLRTKLDAFFSRRERSKEIPHIHSMELMDIMGSSLSQQSFSQVVLEENQQPSDEDTDMEGGAMELSDHPEETDSTKSKQDTVNKMVDLDQLNSSTFMPVLTEMIKTLSEPKEKKDENENKEDKPMPSWMLGLRKAFDHYQSLHHDKTIDTREVYIAKLITNYPEAFEEHAHEWVVPLLRFVVKGHLFGEHINYLVHDICVILGVWGRYTFNANAEKAALPESNRHKAPCDFEEALYSCLDYLMEHAYHPSHGVQKDNIEVIRKLFENWGCKKVVPTKTIYKQFTHPQKDYRRNIIGLQLVALCYSYGYPVYNEKLSLNQHGLSEEKFFEGLSENLTMRGTSSSNLRIYAAELMGWSLDYIARGKNTHLYEKLRNLYREKFIDFANSRHFNLTQYFRCINALSIHDKDISYSILHNVSVMLYNATQDEKVEGLRFIEKCYHTDDEFNNSLYTTLKQAGLNRMFTSKDENLQLAALKVVDTYFEHLKVDEIDSIFRMTGKVFPEHNNDDCRATYYSFVMKTYARASSRDRVKLMAKAQLFRGLIDKKTEIALAVFHFVTRDFDIGDNIRETLKKITGNMYISDTEDIYLMYATRMILENTKKTFDFNEPIFQNSLAGSNPADAYRQFDTTWHTFCSMQPLFVDSQAKPKKLNLDDIEANLRDTQSKMDFTQTVDSNESLTKTFNPASQESDVSMVYDEDDDKKTDYQLLEKKETTMQDKYAVRRHNGGSAAALSRMYADRYERLRKKKETLINHRMEAREKQVVMTRAYREGEIPDVKIAHKDLLLPLEVLATADYNISRLLYSSLAVSILNEMKSVSSDQEYSAYQDEFIKMITKNLTMSELYFTPTIGSFLRIIFDLGASVPALLIKVASSKSDNHHIGIAILENQLMNGDHGERPPKRSSKLTPTQEKWIHLSLLYQHIDELEIFESVYLTNVASNEKVRQALRYQIEGNYAVAFNSFDEALQQAGSAVDATEYNLWQEQMLFCRMQLGQWDHIGSDTRDALRDNWDLLWSDKEDPYLEYFIRSYSKAGDERIMTGEEWKEFRQAERDKKLQLQNAGESRKDVEHKMKTWIAEKRAWLPNEINPIFQFLDNAYKNTAHKEKLLSRFACGRLASVIASVFVTHRIVVRLVHGRANSQGIQFGQIVHWKITVETEDYLELHKKIEEKTCVRQDIHTFLKALSLRHPDCQNDRMDVWHDILWSRLEYLKDLQQPDDASLSNELSVAKNQFVNITEDTAIKQHNISILPTIRKYYDDSARYMKNINSIRYLQINFAGKNLSGKALPFEKLLIKSFDNKIAPHASNQQQCEQKLVLAASFDILKQQLIAEPRLVKKALENQNSGLPKFVAKNKLDGIINDPKALVDHLQVLGFSTLIEAEQFVDNQVAAQRADYLWKLGRYCDESLHTLQEETNTIKPNIDPVTYSNIVIRHYFEAMDLGHQEASNYFPRLLELIELYPETGETFKTCSLQISAIWKYIRWIPQLVSSMNGPIAPYILPAIQKLAEAYPNALYYPMQISCEIYELRKNTLPKDICDAIERIMQMIRSPILEEFSNELKRLTDPYHIVKDFLAYIRSDLANKNVPQSFITAKYNEFYQLVLNNYSERLGAITKKQAAKFANHFIRSFGENGSKISKLTEKDVAELERFCRENLNTGNNSSEEKNLKSYSPWLNAFKSIEHDQELEIPGQYDGLSKPYPELHAKVASVDPTLLVMHSMRRPKRVKIYGTDEKEYMFLVKGGEDLRLDERIEQAFGVMNDAVRKNKFCSSQNIQIATYKVIPMASSLGIIEWVDNTKPLKACMEEQGPSELLINAKRKYNRWITSNKRTSKNLAERYHAAFAQPRDIIVSRFKEAESFVPANLVRNYLFKLASSPEAFLFSRKEFAYSLSCISIFGYIMGIGDRHMDNFLVDMKSGRLIPIDFGYAFGVASELLPIPEIVPFRLTRQLVTVLEPLGISGILEDAMTHILSAVQAEKELLLNIMTVFVKEPHLEWKQAAKKQSKLQKRDEEKSSGIASSADKTNSLDQGIAWYPQSKINIVKRKLSKGNPASITSTELSNGHHNRGFCKDVIAIAKGVPGIDIRADVGDICKDTNEQVRCLINQATDPRVLGVGYEGWAPFY